jgi:hypothetical protein
VDAVICVSHTGYDGELIQAFHSQLNIIIGGKIQCYEANCLKKTKKTLQNSRFDEMST